MNKVLRQLRHFHCRFSPLLPPLSRYAAAALPYAADTPVYAAVSSLRYAIVRSAAADAGHAVP